MHMIGGCDLEVLVLTANASNLILQHFWQFDVDLNNLDNPFTIYYLLHNNTLFWGGGGGWEGGVASKNMFQF